jgi:hypothetical protein
MNQTIGHQLSRISLAQLALAARISPPPYHPE